MKRREFVQLSLSSSILAVNALADEMNLSRKEVLVVNGADRDEKPFEFLDGTFQVKVSGKDTEGRCAIFNTIRHKKTGPALTSTQIATNGFW